VALRNLEASITQGAGDRPTGFRFRAALGEQNPANISVTGEAGPWPAEADLKGLPFSLDVRARRLSNDHLAPLLNLATLGLNASGPADLDLRLRGRVGAADLEGSLDLGSVALRAGQIFRKASGEPGKVAVAGRVGGGRLDLHRLEVLLKGAELRGSLSVERFAAPRVEFDLSSPLLDLQRFFAAAGTKGAFLREASAASPPPAASLPPGFTVSGRLRVDRLIYGGLTLSTLSARLGFQNGTVSGSEFLAALEGGTVQGGAEIKLGGVPEVKVSLTFRGIQTGPVLKALLKPDWTLDSTFGLHVAAKARGGSLEDLLKTADGTGRVAVEEGRFKGYRPAERLEEALGPVLAARGITVKLDRFESLTGNYTVAAGSLRTADLLLVQGENRMVASGRYGLTDRTLDFAVVLQTAQGTIDAKVLGTADKPQILPGTGGAIWRRLGRELEKRLGPEGAAPYRELFQPLLKP
jgi:hypothetical protein